MRCASAMAWEASAAVIAVAALTLLHGLVTIRHTIN